MEKWKEKLSGTKDADKEKDKENSSEEGEDAEASSDESGIPKKKVEKAAVDADGYQVFKMPWSLNFNYSLIFPKTVASLSIGKRCAILTVILIT